MALCGASGDVAHSFMKLGLASWKELVTGQYEPFASFTAGPNVSLALTPW